LAALPAEKGLGVEPELFKRSLTATARFSFLDELREARTRAQKNAEDFSHLLFVFERLGAFLSIGDDGTEATDKTGFNDFFGPLSRLAQFSALGNGRLQGESANWHSSFDVLFDLVREARNGAMHEGAKARHLTEHAIELALVFEEALVHMPKHLSLVRDVMVRSPVTAAPWQPVSFARQVMLTNSFSFLPIYIDSEWRLLSDQFLARYLRRADGDNPTRRTWMARTISRAVRDMPHDPLPKARLVEDTTTVQQLLTFCEEWHTARNGDYVDGLSAPILVTDPRRDPCNAPVGLVTAFDLL
jgi:hypothetical protein